VEAWLELQKRKDEVRSIMHRHKMLRAIAVMGAMTDVDDPGMEAALIGAGFTKKEAALLVAFVPQAFARPVLEKLGVTQFSESVSATNRDDESVNIPLGSIPIYTTALGIAREHRRVGLIDQKKYERLVYRSASIEAVTKALNAHTDVKGAAVAEALVSMNAEDLRTESWFVRLKRTIFR
jgi:hypothetical protein